MAVFRLLGLFLLLVSTGWSTVFVGTDLLFETPHRELLRGKRVGLIANQTAVNSKLVSTLDLLREHRKSLHYTITGHFGCSW